MKILLLGPAYPYRGGLSAIIERMAKEYIELGHEVRIFTFSLQYPSLLFPGKTQYRDTKAPEDLLITRELSTINPFSWIKTALRIRHWKADMVILKYWTPFMAPAFGTVARISRFHSTTKFICQIDNVEPHEHHFWDKLFNRYFLKSIDGFVYMSKQVHGELSMYTSAPALFSFHPMFENMGDRVDKNVAFSKLNLSKDFRYFLFFGLIREYKGLDLLLDAFLKLNLDDVKLIVAGEFYEKKDRYLQILDKLGERVVLHDHFIDDDSVKYYFSAAEAVVLPYKTATQSGVTQIAYNFLTPMIVTDVGGLKEIVKDGVAGYVVKPKKEDIMQAMLRMLQNNQSELFSKLLVEERKRFSWFEMCSKILEVYKMTKH
ncbi:MAG: glycosyltransferase family 4 protein [Alistipes sp.]|nr:glycosyltransferase family 4 protein [Candidatus Alistipes equi]